MLRASSYTIYVDLPEERDEVLLIHGFTGAYDKVSRRVARYLRAQGGKTRESSARDGWQPRGETLETLERRGYLTSRTPEEEEVMVTRLAESLAVRERRVQPGYVFMLTYSCNLRCPYCFQDHMRTDPAYRPLLRTMSPEVADRIFAAMPALEEKHGLAADDKRARNILFFGGEPLLAANRPIVEHIARRLEQSGGGKLSAITNGTEIDAYADLLGPDRIERLQITLDGPPAEHDSKRIYADGAGSFTKIADNVTLALDRGVRILLRMNIDWKNLAWMPELAREMTERKWRSYSNFTPYVAPVHASGQDGEHELMDSWVLRKGLLDLQRKHPELRTVGHLDDGLHGRLRQIFTARQNPMPGFKASFCGAYTTMYIFDAFGDMYACWEHTGDGKTRIGQVGEGGALSFSAEMERLWRERTVSANPVCRRCRYAFYCGGGCANLAWRRTGNLLDHYCDAFAQRFRATAAKAYLDFTSGKPPEPIQQSDCDR